MKFFFREELNIFFVFFDVILKIMMMFCIWKLVGYFDNCNIVVKIRRDCLLLVFFVFFEIIIVFILSYGFF